MSTDTLDPAALERAAHVIAQALMPLIAQLAARPAQILPARMTTDDVAAYIGVSARQVRQRHATMGLPVPQRAKPGAPLYWLREDVDAWVAKGGRVRRRKVVA